MEIIGNLNKREIVYVKYGLKDPWFKDFPTNEWLLFAIAEKDDINIFNEINRHAIDNNVVYVCSVGEKCELFHDVIDDDIVIRDVENEYLPSHLIMTTWHDDFDEGFWFAISAAFGDGPEIKRITCIDISNDDFRPKLRELIEKIDAGWFPP
jgi:hypothetical protein